MNAPEHVAQGWHPLGRPAPSTLSDARRQAHWAAQVAASVGYTHVEPAPDWSHTSLAWIDALGALSTHTAPGPPGFRAALRPADLTLLLLDADGAPLDAMPLNGRMLDDGYAWLRDAIRKHTGLDKDLVRPDHELPAHPAGGGAPFALSPPDAFAELARWYANANRVLQSLSASSPEASPVRTWPHHFDMAVLATFDADRDPEEARSLGVGMTPGDGSYAEPYWYVTPWPYPDNPDLPPLDGEGTWHTEGWFGAVLTAPKLVAAGAAQAERVQAFVRSGVAACRTLLALPSSSSQKNEQG